MNECFGRLFVGMLPKTANVARLAAPTPGIPLTEVSTTEGSDPDYIANEGQSCFHCKTHLYSALEAVAAQAGAESRRGSSSGGGRSGHPQGLTEGRSAGVAGAAGEGTVSRSTRRVVLFNGTNKDDKRDTTRCGRGVSNPLCFSRRCVARSHGAHVFAAGSRRSPCVNRPKT